MRLASRIRPVVKIYTRKGDDGTHLALVRRARAEARRADRRLRHDRRGQLAARRRPRPLRRAARHRGLAADILQLQQELFVAGAELATAPEAAERLEDGVSRVTEGMVDALEVDIDRYMRQVDLPPQFVIPGGTALSASLDVARAMLRRAERRVVQLRDDEGLGSEVVLAYLNRASDLLFAMARFADEPNPQLFEGRRKEAGGGDA